MYANDLAVVVNATSYFSQAVYMDFLGFSVVPATNRKLSWQLSAKFTISVLQNFNHLPFFARDFSVLSECFHLPTTKAFKFYIIKVEELCS